jgi:hypothetical protein
MSAISWIFRFIFIGLIVGLGYYAWGAYNSYVDDNCQADQGIAECFAENAAFGVVELVWGTTVGTLSGLFSGGRWIGEKTKPSNWSVFGWSPFG